MSALTAQITEQMKDAMRAKDKARLGTIRLILADIKRIEVDERIELDDARVLAVLDKMVKQRKDSIAQFQLGGRQDLVDKEQAELALLMAYMPAQMSEAEIAQVIETAVLQANATGLQDMGKVMALIKPLLAGKADMGLVSQMLKTRLAQ
jgi:uncharacterized protein YqeY